MMKTLLVLAALVAFTLCTDIDFRGEYRRAIAKYASADHVFPMRESLQMSNLRFSSFCKFSKRVHQINEDESRPFTAVNNFLSILTEAEQMQYRGLNVSGHENTVRQVQERIVLRSDHPPSRDFSNKISGIKNQANCGSCWTFAATAALEGEIYFKNSRRGVSLSEQEYMECATSRDGCQGGWMEDCYDYSIWSDRIATTDAAPYTAIDSRRCNYGNKANALTESGVRVTGNINIWGDDQLLHYAASHIVSVAIKVSDDFQTYSDGVFVDRTCNVQPDHAVAVVGYGIQGNRKYWKVRNSWGIGWGDKGYILMDREKPNMCMISTYSHIPEVECRGNNCTPADPDEDSDGGDDDGDDGGDDDSDDGDDSTPNLCWKQVGLGRCLRNENAANSVCEEVGQENCAVIRLKRCWYGASANSNVKGNAFMWLNMPCGDGDGSVDGECDADAGLVYCSDCNCCKHEHMCNDRA